MKPHELDVVSLLAGLVFLALGGVGLLQGAGVVDSGAPWAVIGAVAAVGLTGIVVSVRRLAASDPAAPIEPAESFEPAKPAEPAESFEPAGLVDDEPEPVDEPVDHEKDAPTVVD